MPNKNDKKIERIIQKEEETKQMSHLVGALAHEWKQPLNILGLLIQDIRDAYEFGEMDKEYLDNFVNRGMSNIRDISHSIDDFRLFFEPRFEAQDVALKSCIEGIMAMLKHQYESHKIAIELEGEDFKRTLYINSFRQGIMNILGLIKETYDTLSVPDKKIIIRVDPDAKTISIKESTHSLDGAMIAKALGDADTGATELKSYTPVRNAKRLLEDSADANLTHSQNEGDFTFTITF